MGFDRVDGEPYRDPKNANKAGGYRALHFLLGKSLSTEKAIPIKIGLQLVKGSRAHTRVPVADGRVRRDDKISIWPCKSPGVQE
ncbi:hypothetical protein TNCV_1134281 [Trichonephila clavipes]|nr:hypothetical protein TNCV_1134281 [Trichonephila clavipes]